MIDGSVALRVLPDLAAALLTTGLLALGAIVLSSVGGTAAAALTMSRRVALASIGGAYREIMRNTPLLILMLVIFFGLASLGLRLSPFASALTALTLQHSAYTGEIYRGAIRAVPRQQWEAGFALGMRPGRVLARIIVPQALPRVLPLLGNQCVAITKDTAVASIIALAELTQAGKIAIEETGAPFQVLALLAATYLCLTLAIMVVARVAEARLRYVT